mmetsp:Transcript_34891/g.108534  ORF Transcript_34891/g.108534 Transcript_34891/m.108534 type:complete len:228 (+) Transcript_34891:1135-1818(+)
MSLETACFSMYSDMSRRIILESLSKSSVAKAFANSVLPTPVGPGKRKEPIGRLRLFRPAALTSTALATASAASSWPSTLALRAGPNRKSRSRSPCDSRCTGMPVQRATTSAMSSTETASRSTDNPWAFSPSNRWMRFLSPGMASYLRSETVSKSPRTSANCILLFNTSSFCFASCNSESNCFSRSYCALTGSSFSMVLLSSFCASLRWSTEALSDSFVKALTSTFRS